MKSQDKVSEAAFFDGIAEAGEYDALTQRAYDRLVLFFERFIKPEPGEKLIDLGCGTGAFTKELKKFSLNITAVDLSQNAVSSAKKDNPGYSAICSDIEKLSFADESFDVVVFSAVLHHFKDFSRCASEAYRVLKKGGRFYAFDPNMRNPFMRIYRSARSGKGRRALRPVGPEASPYTVNERLLSKEELEKAFKEAGFSASVLAVSGIELRQANRGIFDRFLTFYNLLERGMASLPLARYYGSHLITYGVKT
ncbi:MAG: methyltransferase domain-containing protein [Candidatus Omnitrophica bacterium]|nr:methyltransferase domain-containing protein [Candidatus Omnitrophota bacterium]